MLACGENVNLERRFMAMRILHTYTMIKAIQPWRTVVFTIGAIAMFAMMIHILIEVVL